LSGAKEIADTKHDDLMADVRSVVAEACEEIRHFEEIISRVAKKLERDLVI
jgi:hypothetical protein